MHKIIHKKNLFLVIIILIFLIGVVSAETTIFDLNFDGGVAPAGWAEGGTADWKFSSNYAETENNNNEGFYWEDGLNITDEITISFAAKINYASTAYAYVGTGHGNEDDGGVEGHFPAADGYGLMYSISAGSNGLWKITGSTETLLIDAGVNDDVTRVLRADRNSSGGWTLYVDNIETGWATDSTYDDFSEAQFYLNNGAGAQAPNLIDDFNLITATPIDIYSSFDSNINTYTSQINLTDTSTVSGGLTIADWNWYVGSVLKSTDQNYDYPTTEGQDLNVCLRINDLTETYPDISCSNINTGKWLHSKYDTTITPGVNILFENDSNTEGNPITNYSWLIDSIEEAVTQDYNKTDAMEETDYNVCLEISNAITSDITCNTISTGKWLHSKFSYIENIGVGLYFQNDSNAEGLPPTNYSWLIDSVEEAVTQDYNKTDGTQLTDYNVCLEISNAIASDINCDTISTGDWEAPTTTFSISQIGGAIGQNITLTCTDNNSGCKQINFRINEGDWNYYSIGANPLHIIFSGTGDNNIQYYSTDNADNNETINTNDFTIYGIAIFNFYDDTTEIGITGVSLEFDGVPYDSNAESFITIDLNGISEGSKNIIIQKTGYTEKNFYLTFNEFTDANYNIGLILSSQSSIVAFQVFTETGALKTNTTFFGYDNDNNFLIDVKITDSQGRMTFILNETKSDYNFISATLLFGTTLWTINKPKDATTLEDIAGNWKYSITGSSYSSETNIVTDITKILLQNTVNPYYIRIQDVNETYAISSFGLQSITIEDTKELNPYLYPLGSANLVLIKLIDFSTNQPIATFNEMQLSLFTDSNGLIDIGTYINDSTGTYNIYMDVNAKYQLIISDQTFILNPTLSIYYVYLARPINLYEQGAIGIIDANNPGLSSPVIMSEVREFFFGCSAEEENCYPSMIFSLVFVVILAVGLSVYLTVGSLEQSILIIVLFGVFTFIGFIPIWLFALTAVISFMWGIFR